MKTCTEYLSARNMEPCPTKARTRSHIVRYRCPLHEERTGSFYVDTVADTFKCFGCGKYGTAEELAAMLEPQ